MCYLLLYLIQYLISFIVILFSSVICLLIYARRQQQKRFCLSDTEVLRILLAADDKENGLNDSDQLVRAVSILKKVNLNNIEEGQRLAMIELFKNYIDLAIAIREEFGS